MLSFKHLRHTRVAALCALAVAATAVSFIAASPASAYARGCQPWNTINIDGWPVPSGLYCAEVDGYGTWIYQVEGDFSSIGNVCNWDITAEFFDSHWGWHRTFVSPHNNGCSHTGRQYISVPYYMSQLVGSDYGYMCSTLRVAWKRVTSVCHYIHP